MSSLKQCIKSLSPKT